MSGTTPGKTGSGRSRARRSGSRVTSGKRSPDVSHRCALSARALPGPDEANDKGPRQLCQSACHRSRRCHQATKDDVQGVHVLVGDVAAARHDEEDVASEGEKRLWALPSVRSAVSDPSWLVAEDDQTEIVVLAPTAHRGEVLEAAVAARSTLRPRGRSVPHSYPRSATERRRPPRCAGNAGGRGR